MKTLLVGAGAIGASIAVKLVEGGYTVEILAHGQEAKKEIETLGITLDGAWGDHKAFFKCYATPQEIGDQKFDIILLATKHGAMIDCAKMILPFLNDDSLVVGLQNGLCTKELASVVGKRRAVGTMLGYGATRNNRHSITLTSKGRMFVGTLDENSNPNILKLCEMFNCVLPTKISPDITREQFSKLIVNSCINALSAICGQTLGKVVSDIRVRKIFLQIAREGLAVADKMGVDVPKYGLLLDYRFLKIKRNKYVDFLCRYAVFMVSKVAYSSVKPSTLQSLEKGEKTEIDIFNGFFAKKGEDLGVDTPVNTKITQMVHQIENGERKSSLDNLKEFETLI